MISNRDMLLRIQDDCYQRLKAHAWFSTVALVFERKALTEQEVAKMISVRQGRGGKIGACIIVQMPLLTPESDNAQLRCQAVQAFTVLEHPELNRGSQGSRKSAEEIAVELLDLFQFAGVTRTKQVMSGYPGGAIVPDPSWPGLRAYEVRLQTFITLGRSRRCALPVIDPDEGELPVVVTLTAEADAAVYYTTNGTYPSSQNAAATLYSAPFEIATPCRLRVAAERDGFQQSNVAEAEFGPNFEFTEEFSEEFS